MTESADPRLYLCPPNVWQAPISLTAISTGGPLRPPTYRASAFPDREQELTEHITFSMVEAVFAGLKAGGEIRSWGQKNFRRPVASASSFITCSYPRAQCRLGGSALLFKSSLPIACCRRDMERSSS